MKNLSLLIMQLVILCAAAPLLSGVIRKVKNNLRMRRGPGIFQPYYNLSKLFSKEEVVSSQSSWVLRITPYIVFASSVAALLFVPSLLPGRTAAGFGDVLVMIFILGLGRFFLSLAGLDTGSAFGGMGSSREMFISSLAEPVALIAVFAVALQHGTTNMGAVSVAGTLHLSTVAAAAGLLFVVIAETSRLPVDNQETHLELTMIHEAMVLEYSGRSLGLIELSSHIKQVVFFALVAALLFPLPAGCGLAFCIAAFAAKLLGIAVAVAVLEVSIAKMRLFRVPDFLSFGFAVAGIAVIMAAMGM